jgi:hypothetical protein
VMSIAFYDPCALCESGGVSPINGRGNAYPAHRNPSFWAELVTTDLDQQAQAVDLFLSDALLQI